MEIARSVVNWSSWGVKCAIKGGQYLQYIESGFKAYQSTEKVIQLYRKGALTKAEKAELLNETMLAIFHTANCSLAGYRAVSSSGETSERLKLAHILASGGAGFFDLTQLTAVRFIKGEDFTSREEVIKVFAIVFIRCAETVQVAKSKPCYKCEDGLDQLEMAAKAGTFLMLIIDEKSGTRTAMRAVAEFSRRRFQRIRQPLSASVQNVATPLINGPVQNQQNAGNAIVPIFSFDAPNEEAADLQTLENLQQQSINEMIDWKNLERIPDEFEDDDLLKLFICRHTQRYIRFIVCPVNYDDIYYERAEINRLLQANPVNKPAGWPEDLEFTAAHIQANRSLQYLINGRLEKLAAEMSEIDQRNRNE